jgi:Endoribonuclease L-PSP
MSVSRVVSSSRYAPVIGGDDPYAQTQEALRKISAVLAEAGTDLSHVVQTRMYPHAHDHVAAPVAHHGRRGRPRRCRRGARSAAEGPRPCPDHRPGLGDQQDDLAAGPDDDPRCRRSRLTGEAPGTPRGEDCPDDRPSSQGCSTHACLLRSKPSPISVCDYRRPPRCPVAGPCYETKISQGLSAGTLPKTSVAGSFDYRDASLLDQFKVELVTLEVELGMSSH